MKILLIAPFYNKAVPGESWSTYKWVQGISERHDVTVLTTHKKGWSPEQSPTAAKRVINWDDPALPKSMARLNRELKPTYFLFYRRARKWIKDALKRGESFDLVHQINPLALRYPCPAVGLGLKYIIGPLAGSLSNPRGLEDEAREKIWFRKLRNLDALRITHDPWLRRSYSDADVILGVAPYVSELLKPAHIKRFEIASETGVESISGTPKSPPNQDEPLRLLYVGRIIRTKGVLDAIRAVAIASQNCNLRFDVIGQGDMLDSCRKEAASLGVDNLIHFHGRQPRSEVDRWYEQAHIFLFPSFREPSGNVVFEALGFGLPVITSTHGGPGYVVNEECGVRVQTDAPTIYSQSLATAIADFATHPHKVSSKSANALQRITNVGLWEKKHEQLHSLYHELTQKGLKQNQETTRLALDK